jgi:prevent-host-death family protein
MSAHIGIRELRQDLSAQLRRVKAGERLVVTERNRPVAVLAPLPENEDWYDRLVAEGRLIPGDGGDILEVEPVDIASSDAVMDALLQGREERL